QLIPASSAARTVASCSVAASSRVKSAGTGPAPNEIAEIRIPVVPSGRYCIRPMVLARPRICVGRSFVTLRHLLAFLLNPVIHIPSAFFQTRAFLHQFRRTCANDVFLNPLFEHVAGLPIE